MAYELKQELKLTQSLVMTPQLQLAIKLLQLSRLELVEMVREEVQTNPVLEDVSAPEVEAGAEAPAEAPPKPEIDWETYLQGESEYRQGGIDFSARDDEEDDFMSNISAAGGSLQEHLTWQLGISGLPHDDVLIGEFIIGNVDDDGYLRILDRDHEATDDEHEASTLAEIARCAGAAAEDVARVLTAIQQFDPPGVASRTLRECLLVQARALDVRDTVVEEVIAGHLDRLASRNFKAIAKALGVTAEDVIEAAKVIHRSLNPTPGAGFGVDESRAIVPDVYIHKVGDEYIISLNEDGMPKLKISPYYRELLKNNGAATADNAKGYIQDKLRSAVWLIKSVHQRQRTVYRVVECIVKFQREFLDQGLKYLKPLVLKDVAAEIGVHESTVSRVTSNKYVQTPRGIFELKYFFSTGMSNDSGGEVAVEYIKEKLRKIMEAEDPKKPLSDAQLVERLKGEGIAVARRTVTKYREAMGFLSSSGRKAHF